MFHWSYRTENSFILRKRGLSVWRGLSAHPGTPVGRAMVRPHTKSRATGRFEVWAEGGFFLKSWSLLSTGTQNKTKKSLNILLILLWQDVTQCYKEIMSWATASLLQEGCHGGFCPVGLRRDEILKSSLESVYFQHLIMKTFTTQRKTLEQSWMHILASSCICTPCLFRELSFAGWGNWIGNCEKGRECFIDG